MDLFIAETLLLDTSGCNLCDSLTGSRERCPFHQPRL